MEADSYINLEKKLFRELGEGRTKKIVGDLTKIIVANNFDVTPTILNEILVYTKQTIFLHKV